MMPVPLLRSRSDRFLGGIASGMAVYFGMDVSLMRVLFVVAALLTGGAAVLAYIVLWIVIPEGEPVPRDAQWAPVSDAEE